jgi:uncharacterized protein YkwD
MHAEFVTAQFPDPGFKVVIAIAETWPSARLWRRNFTPVQGRVACTIAGMRRHRTVHAVVLFCSIIVCIPAHAEAPEMRRAEVARVAAEVVDLTNVERADRGRGPLRTNPRLMRAAQMHAEQMARAQRMAHDLPRAAYPHTEDRLLAARYHWQMYGENVAFGQPSAREALRSWMRSSGHRRNILEADYTELGTGYAVDRAGRPYFVQVFGRPSPR